MSHARAALLALALLAGGCAGSGPRPVARGEALPPPARESRAGARSPGAGPAPAASPGTPAPRPSPAPPDPAVVPSGAAARAVAAAAARVGRPAPADCAALVREVWAAAGVRLPHTTAAGLLADARARAALRRRVPRPGDLAFLADRPGGPGEHVGLVEKVLEGDVAVVLHATERGISRVRVSAAAPWASRDAAGRTINDLLVVGGGKVTAGRLLVGFASAR